VAALMIAVQAERTGLRPRPSPSRLSFEGARGSLILNGCADLAAIYRRIMPSWPVRRGGGAERAVRVVRMGRDYAITSPLLREPLWADTPTSAACASVIEVARSFLTNRPGWLCLHCAAFETGNGLVALVGTNHAGKSTLAARLLAEGARLYCDDMLPLSPADNRGMALGLSPRLRLPLPPRASTKFRRFVARHLVSHDDRYGYMHGPTLADHGSMAPVGTLILLERRSDGPAWLEPVDPVETMRHLVLQNLHRDISAGAATERMYALMAKARCLRLVYSDLEDATALLLGGGLEAPLQAEGERQPTFDSLDVPPADIAARYRQAEGVHMRDVDGAAFVVTPDETVIQLDPLASAIFGALAEPTMLGEIIEALEEAYPDARPAQIAADIARLVGALEAKGLVEIVR
jgi:hypothetical protein